MIFLIVDRSFHLEDLLAAIPHMCDNYLVVGKIVFTVKHIYYVINVCSHLLFDWLHIWKRMSAKVLLIFIFTFRHVKGIWNEKVDVELVKFRGCMISFSLLELAIIRIVFLVTKVNELILCLFDDSPAWLLKLLQVNCSLIRSLCTNNIDGATAESSFMDAIFSWGTFLLTRWLSVRTSQFTSLE